MPDIDIAGGPARRRAAGRNRNRSRARKNHDHRRRHGPRSRGQDRRAAADRAGDARGDAQGGGLHRLFLRVRRRGSRARPHLRGMGEPRAPRGAFEAAAYGPVARQARRDRRQRPQHQGFEAGPESALATPRSTHADYPIRQPLRKGALHADDLPRHRPHALPGDVSRAARREPRRQGARRRNLVARGAKHPRARHRRAPRWSTTRRPAAAPAW